jgi:type II secretory pathway pseudopilin PulG
VIRRLLASWPRDRRHAQSGATLVELLVSVMIMGMALTLIIGTFSTGLLQATVAKRDTAATAVIEYELEQGYNASAQSYSDCFATEDAGSPPTRASFRGTCTGGSYTLRADVQIAPGPGSTQLLSVTVISLLSSANVGRTVQVIKSAR